MNKIESKELPVGTTLQAGKNTIERVLGAGGFGITYYAQHNGLGNYFAIKEFFISTYCMRNTLRKTVLLQGIDAIGHRIQRGDVKLIIFWKGEEISPIFEDKIQRAKKEVKGYIPNTKLSAQKVIEKYGNLWYIERAFRMNKTDLRIRPIYHHLRNRIEGHICICFTAYTILLEMERMLKYAKSEITIKRAQELTKTMYQLTYRLPMSKLTKILGMDNEQQQLYNMVGLWINRK